MHRRIGCRGVRLFRRVFLSWCGGRGGGKSVKRYQKLMLKRINWAAAVKEENMHEEVDDDDENVKNKCVLVWQGSVTKPSFQRFLVHECSTENAARKVFYDAGVGHYWDLVVNFSRMCN
ncbi:unnamed protein product [Lactuca virosa]|uniref:Small nuclear ribonucleoprotein Prp3 C-terminal domain-containing protein n=1 Tax=Lactuca virosa TaxID=75947 RepID=A0AAU9M550_9ASTR|nr:unnamed protein product [Lactuca virosa]